MQNTVAAVFTVLLALTPMLFAALAMFAWMSHVIFTIIHEMWVLLIVGSLLAPIGVIHGFMIWLDMV